MSGIYWLASYPKSGNTWFRVYLNALLNTEDAPIGFDDLQTGAIASARSWLDDVLGFDTADLYHGEAHRLRPHVYDWSVHADDIGYHKIHDAYSITNDGLPLTGKTTPQGATLGALYIIRNPLDIAASYANHNGTTLDRSVKVMGQTHHTLAPARPRKIMLQLPQTLGSWSQHVKSWVNAKDLNIHVLRYEDMIETPNEAFAAATKFLNLSHTDADIDTALAAVKFDRLKTLEQKAGFRERPHRSMAFFRKGRAGGWREELSAKQAQQIIKDHGEVMSRFGYLDSNGNPI